MSQRKLLVFALIVALSVVSFGAAALADPVYELDNSCKSLGNVIKFEDVDSVQNYGGEGFSVCAPFSVDLSELLPDGVCWQAPGPDAPVLVYTRDYYSNRCLSATITSVGQSVYTDDAHQYFQITLDEIDGTLWKFTVCANKTIECECTCDCSDMECFHDLNRWGFKATECSPCPARAVKVTVNGLEGSDTATVNLTGGHSYEFSNADTSHQFTVSPEPAEATYTASITLPPGYTVTGTQPAGGAVTFSMNDYDCEKEISFTVTKQEQSCKRSVTVNVSGPADLNGIEVNLTGSNDYNETIAATAGTADFNVPDSTEPATYTASVSVEGYTPNPATGQVTFEQDICGNLVLNLGLNKLDEPEEPCDRTITVHVFNSDNQPISEAGITITGTGLSEPLTGTTDLDGSVTMDLPDLAVDASYDITVESQPYEPGSGTISFTEDDTPCSKEITITLMTKDNGGGDDNDDDNDDGNGGDNDGDNGGDNGGGTTPPGNGGTENGDGTTPAPEVTPTPEVSDPQAPVPAAMEPPAAPPKRELPFTGGNPMPFVYCGLALTGLGVLLRHRFK